MGGNLAVEDLVTHSVGLVARLEASDETTYVRKAVKQSLGKLPPKMLARHDAALAARLKVYTEKVEAVCSSTSTSPSVWRSCSPTRRTSSTARCTRWAPSNRRNLRSAACGSLLTCRRRSSTGSRHTLRGRAPRRRRRRQWLSKGRAILKKLPHGPAKARVRGGLVRA